MQRPELEACVQTGRGRVGGSQVAQNPAGPSQEFGLQWQWNVKNPQGFEHVMASDRSGFNSVKNGLPG